LNPGSENTSVVSELTPEIFKIYNESLGIKVYEYESKIELQMAKGKFWIKRRQ